MRGSIPWGELITFFSYERKAGLLQLWQSVHPFLMRYNELTKVRLSSV